VKTNKLYSALLLSISAISLVIMPASAWAVTVKTVPAVNNNSDTLKISPVRADLTLNPGTSGQVKVSVSNLTGSSIGLKLIENDFVAGDENGTPAIILDENSYAPTHSLKRFMTKISQTITVAPGVTTTVPVTITVPKNAQAGGYFGSVRFVPAGSDASKNVSINASAASLVLLTVPGPTVEKVTMTNFDIQQNGGTASNFRNPDNLGLFLRFENKGNIQEAPFGLIYVQKGKKVVYQSKFNENTPRDVILPDSARRWTVPLKGFGKFGKYTVGATIGYGNKGQSIQISKTVWIIPTVIIMSIVVGVVVLAAIILGLWVFLRNYKRRILRSSRRRY
jgi:hypothetical protein